MCSGWNILSERKRGCGGGRRGGGVGKEAHRGWRGNSGLKILAERKRSVEGGGCGGGGGVGGGRVSRWWGAKRAGVGGQRNREGEMRRES